MLKAVHFPPTKYVLQARLRQVQHSDLFHREGFMTFGVWPFHVIMFSMFFLSSEFHAAELCSAGNHYRNMLEKVAEAVAHKSFIDIIIIYVQELMKSAFH